MKPALAENVEEKERKHGEKRKSHDNLCPDSQHGAKLPTRRPWLQAPPKEHQAGVLPALATLAPCVSGLALVHHAETLPWKSVLLEAPPILKVLPLEDKPGAPTAPSFSPASDHPPSLVFYPSDRTNYGPKT